MKQGYTTVAANPIIATRNNANNSSALKKTVYRMMAVFFVFGFLLSFSNANAQVPTPTNNSFETDGAITNSVNGWTVDALAADGTGTTTTVNARTGVYAYKYTTALTYASQTNYTLVSTGTVTATKATGTSPYLHVIGWGIASSASAQLTLGAQASSSNAGIIQPALTTSYAQYNVTYKNTSTSAANFFVVAEIASTGTTPPSITGYLDDVVLYTDNSSTTDLTAPTVATGFTNGTITGSSVGFTWTNGSDAATGVKGTVILRTTNTAAAAPTLNNQGLYSTTGTTSGPKTDASGNWTIISITSGATNGSAGSYTDNTVVGGTPYKYAIITYDLAYNYSAALVSGSITAPATYTSQVSGGDWNTPGTWFNSATNATATTAPAAGSAVIVASGFPVTDAATISNQPSSITVNSTLTLNAAYTNPSGSTITVNTGGTLAVAATLTNSGTVTVNGSFQLNQSGYAQTNNLVYGSAGTLIFNNSSGTYGVSSPAAYWPSANSPFNVTIQGAGGVQLNIPETVAGTLAAGAYFYINNVNLTINGTLQLNSGYSWDASSSSPIYGSSSLLKYNSGGAPPKSKEWTATTAGTIGTTQGYPNNVQISNSSTLNYPNGNNSYSAAFINGTLTIDAGSSLYMDYSLSGTGTNNASLNVLKNVIVNGNMSLGNKIGEDLNVGGNWTYGGTLFNPNGRAVSFNGASAQTISGNTTFDYLTINNTSGGVLLSSPVTVTSGLSLAAGILTTTSTNIPTVTATATSGIAGGSATSFINGPVNWTLPSGLSNSASIYTFPIGNTTYLPLAITNLSTGATSPVLQEQAFSGDAGSGATFNSPIATISHTEYWKQTVVSGNYSGGSISLTRQIAPGTANTIGQSAAQAGAYSSIGGTVSGTTTTTISGSSNTGGSTPQYFVMAGQATQYYYGPSITSDITSANAWWTTADATGLGTGGSHPSAASAALSTFYIQNSTTAPTMSTTLTLGANSSITVGGGSSAATFSISSTLTGTVNVTANGTLNIGVATAPTLGTLDAASNVSYTSGSTQTIVAANYGSLGLSGAGSKTFPSGTVGIAGTFSPGSATVTNTSGTINFLSSSAQTIPAFTYFNITNTGNGARTLVNTGTISVAGSFSTGTGNYSIGTSLVAFSGSSAQTIPIIPVASGDNYYKLSYTGSSTGTLAGNISTSSDVTVSGGTLNLTSAGTDTLSVKGNFLMNGGGIDFAGSGATASGGIKVYGNFTQTSGTTNTTAAVLNGAIVFAGTGTFAAPQILTLASSSALSAYTNITVNQSTVLQLGSSLILNNTSTANYRGILNVYGGIDLNTKNITASSTTSAGTLFTLQATGILYTSNTGGIEGAATSASTGNIFSTSAYITKTYTAGAKYFFNGATTTPFPGTFGNPSNINVNAAITLNHPVTPSGVVTIGAIVTTSATNTLALTNTGTGAITGGSITSFINGPLSWALQGSLSNSSNVYAYPVGAGTTYLPYSITSLTTVASAPSLSVTAFAGSQGSTTNSATLLASGLSTTEYWSSTASGAGITNASVSLSRQTALGDLNVIGESATKTGAYTSFGGTVSGTSINNSTNIANSLTQFYVMAKAAYTVTYNGNTNTSGTAPVDASSPYNNGSTVTVLGAGSLVKTGYTFAGWNTAADGSGTAYAATNTFTITANTTLYAQWTINSYTLAYNGNGNDGGTAPSSVTQNYNTTTTVSGAGTLTKTGYTFAGWNTAANGSGTAYAAGATFTFTATTTLYAQWTINSYTLAYNGNGNDGGTAPSSVTQNYNTTTTVSGAGTLTKTGYTFAGWNTAANGSGTAYAAGATFTFTATTTLYAQWTINSYTLSYNGNGNDGGTAPSSVTQNYNTTTTVSGAGTLTRTGYTFAGWNTAANGSGTSYAAGATFTFTATTTLYAQWTINSYTLSYNGNGNDGGTAPSSATQNYNTTITVSGAGTLTKTGYTFAGWNTAANGSGTAYAAGATFTFTATTTLYAQWTINTYTVTFDGNGSTGGSTATQTFTYGVAANLNMNGYVRTGYSFAGWNTAPNGSGTSYADGASYTIGAADAILYAQWNINTYTLTYTAGANGTISGTSPQTVDYNTSGTPVTAVANTGYHFVQWSDGSTSNPRTDAGVTANISVTATFAINTYTLTYTAGANGTISGTSSQTVNYNASGTAVTAVANTGYHFVQWSDGSTSNPRTDAGVTADVTVSASFAINTYTLTYTAGANGTISGTSPQTVNYNTSGTSVTAVANTGYHFVQWSDEVTTATRTDANVTADLNVTATFAINTYTITSGAGSNGTISPDGVNSFNYNDNQTYTITANSGYGIADVVVDGSSVGAVSSYSFNNISADHTITASFTATTPVITSGTTGSNTYGVAGSYTITASNTPTSYNATLNPSGALPSGFSVNTVSGVITVAATAQAGTYSLLVSASNLGGTGNQIVTYTINTKSLTITANDGVKCYGATLVFNGTEFSTSGLVNGDAVNAVSLASAGTSAGAASGTYPITVSSATGTGLSNYTIIYNPGTLTVETLALTYSITNPDCNGNAGTITGAATNGYSPFSYKLNTGSTYDPNGTFGSNPTFGSLASGIYSYAVKDAYGCLAVHTGIPLASLTKTAIVVNGGNTAVCYGSGVTISTTATTGTAPYQYSLDGGTFVPSANRYFYAAAGSHTITVKDASSPACTYTTDPVVITQPMAPLTQTTTVTNANCNATTGSLTITGAGGYGGYTYSLNAGAFQAGGTYAGLAPGTYTVAVKDSHGCTVTGSATITQSVLTTSAITGATTICYGTTTTISTTPAGGTSPYQYSLDGGQYVPSSQRYFGVVGAGNHTISVKDASGCVVSAGSIVISQPSAAVSFTTTITNGNCTSNNLGSITVTAAGGYGGYMYSIDNGVTYQAGASFSNVAAGTYQLVVKDQNNCTGNGTATVKASTLTATAISAGSTQLCFGGTTTISTTGGGGTAPYMYSLDNGTYVASGSRFFTVPAGTHTITVKDNIGCTVTPASVNITQASTAVTISTTIGGTGCSGNGSITVSASGGYSNYSYSDNGTSYQSSNAFTGLPYSSYPVTAKDQNGCTSAVSTVKLLALTSSNIQGNTTVCTGGFTTINIVPSGGKPPYTYSLDGGAYVSSANRYFYVGAGTHTITVKDNAGCTFTPDAVTVTTSGSCKDAGPVTTKQPVQTGLFKVNVYPNPSMQEFHIQLQTSDKSDVQLVVMNMLGEKVYEGKGTAEQIYKFGSNFVSGVYILEIKQGKNFHTVKLVKGN